MHPRDEEKTTFIIDLGTFCYRVMPFGLKNVRATYQRLMDKIFEKIIGTDVEVYVDDMVVKSTVVTNHCKALERVFQVLRRHQLKLNPEKCSFGANLKKCQAIINIRSPLTVKEVQQLARRITTLSRFLSWSAKTVAPIFNTLKKGDAFAWTVESEEAFLRLKALLTTPPTADDVVSVAIVQEREGKQHQMYQRIEKATLTLIIASRRLRPYFQGYPIIVRTALPIKQVLKKPYLTGRMVARSVQLSEFDISYENRGHIKVQALADFITEMIVGGPTAKEDNEWFLLGDGASNQTGSGAGVILEGPNKVLIEQSFHFEFKASNNQAKYEALLAEMRLAKELEAKTLMAKSDSKLITSQVNVEYHISRIRNSWHADHNLSHLNRVGISKRGFSFPLLCCVKGEEAQCVVKEVHEGVCGTHIGGRVLANKIAKVGYYWPTLKNNCMEYVKRCDRCQRFAKRPQSSCTPSLHPDHFTNGEVDILGPFPLAPGQVKYLIVTIDYFTKKIEAEPVATISAEKVKRFYWKKIICHFSLPAEIVSNNGTQFASRLITSFYAHNSPRRWSTRSRTNRLRLPTRGLLRRLKEAKGRWAEELPQVLWSYHTTPHSSTNETPFHLTFDTEALISVEIGESSPQIALFHPAENEDELRVNLDLLQEAPKAKATKHQRRKLAPRQFKHHDLVLRKITRTADNNKLTPIWEGPFRVTNEVGK
ncbi:hypothetical protein CR513_19162, partial [Mucuna pruriens]